MYWAIVILLVLASIVFFFLRIRMTSTEKRSHPLSSLAQKRKAPQENAPLSPVPPADLEQEHKKAQEARLGNDIDMMLQALEKEQDILGRHLLYRDIIAQCFPKRNHDPRMREIFVHTAQAHINEMPRIIPELIERFGSVPYFFTFSYYAIALTEDMSFDQAMDICRLALAYGARDGLGVGFEQRMENIAKQKQRMLSSQAA